MSAPARFSSTEPGGLAGHLDGFVRAVREAGIPVGISQAVDAAEILTVVDLLDREQLRHGLAAVLLQPAAGGAGGVPGEAGGAAPALGRPVETRVPAVGPPPLARRRRDRRPRRRAG